MNKLSDVHEIVTPQFSIQWKLYFFFDCQFSLANQVNVFISSMKNHIYSKITRATVFISVVFISIVVFRIRHRFFCLLFEWQRIFQFILLEPSPGSSCVDEFNSIFRHFIPDVSTFFFPPDFLHLMREAVE